MSANADKALWESENKGLKQEWGEGRGEPTLAEKKMKAGEMIVS